jgi:hypothetical protein
MKASQGIQEVYGVALGGVFLAVLFLNAAVRGARREFARVEQDRRPLD